MFDYLLSALIRGHYDVAQVMVDHDIGINDIKPHTDYYWDRYNNGGAIEVALKLILQAGTKPVPNSLLRSLLDKAIVPTKLPDEIMRTPDKLEMVLSHPRTRHLITTIGTTHLYQYSVHPDCYLILLKHGYRLHGHLILLKERRTKKEFDAILHTIVSVRRLIQLIDGEVVPIDIMRHIKSFMY
jgi:hypothetical protein